MHLFVKKKNPHTVINYLHAFAIVTESLLSSCPNTMSPKEPSQQLPLSKMRANEDQTLNTAQK